MKELSGWEPSYNYESWLKSNFEGTNTNTGKKTYLDFLVEERKKALNALTNYPGKEPELVLEKAIVDGTNRTIDAIKNDLLEESQRKIIRNPEVILNVSFSKCHVLPILSRMMIKHGNSVEDLEEALRKASEKLNISEKDIAAVSNNNGIYRDVCDLNTVEEWLKNNNLTPVFYELETNIGVRFPEEIMNLKLK